MGKHVVAIVRYEKPLESVGKAVELSNGLQNMPANAKVFIKPNIVFWTKATLFPKWGVITTSRVIEDMVIILKDHGISDITIGEGIVAAPKDTETPAHAFAYLGYETLKKRYGVKYINVMERPFEKVDLGDDISLNFNTDIINSDFVVDLPAMKSHNQTVVSLGIKNLKGTINIASRKKCHSADLVKDLNFHVAKLADKMPPIFTLVDGIYTLERGPAFDGKIRRSNLLLASADILSVDMVGANVLGHPVENVPHLVHAANNLNRPMDLSDIEVKGEKIEDVASFHAYDFPYSDSADGNMPTPLAKQGIKGLYYRKYDLSMCTYCSALNGLVLTAIRYAWKGEAWDGVEVLTGKQMQPTPGMKKTILLGKCMSKLHKDNPNIQEAIPIKGCPPDPKDIVKALRQAGIEADSGLFDQIDMLPGFFMARYQDKPEFDEAFFQVK
ncbi:MAG: DUF362 domain-containing protein [Desulfobacteraceae bacterium]|nr:DUF362 domain-containing protein [Desulfobacteraceae bacterium]MBC2755262.1 DUF362 domain-containing protein [Desulfobacteraceae bacterium]